MRRCEDWLAANYRLPDPVSRAVRRAGIPERTLKRRFRTATGTTLIARVQDLRVERAKRLLESSAAADRRDFRGGRLQDASFFRHVFRRRTGLAPADYRRMFRGSSSQPPMAMRASVPPPARGSSTSVPASPKQSRRRSATFARP